MVKRKYGQHSAESYVKLSLPILRGDSTRIGIKLAYHGGGYGGHAR